MDIKGNWLTPKPNHFLIFALLIVVAIGMIACGGTTQQGEAPVVETPAGEVVEEATEAPVVEEAPTEVMEEETEAVTETPTAEMAGTEEMTGTEEGAAGTTGEQQNEVMIQDRSFQPAELTIPAGTTVTWTNNDGLLTPLPLAHLIAQPICSTLAIFRTGKPLPLRLTNPAPMSISAAFTRV